MIKEVDFFCMSNFVMVSLDDSFGVLDIGWIWMAFDEYVQVKVKTMIKITSSGENGTKNKCIFINGRSNTLIFLKTRCEVESG